LHPASPSREDDGMAGFVTPTTVLLLAAALAVVFVLFRLGRDGTGPAGAAGGRRLRRGLRGWRLTKPTRRQAHVGWLVVSALVAFALTRAIALPLFLLVFFALWLCGYWVLVRIYR
jgi:hypothetical protein